MDSQNPGPDHGFGHRSAWLLADFAAAGSLPPAGSVVAPVAALTVPGGAAIGGVDEKEEIA